MAYADPMPNPTTVFQRHTPRLFGLAYRMLGSRADAEDVLQDAYLRWHQTDIEAVQTPEAWLVTIVTRLCIDRLRARRVQGKVTYQVASINGESGLIIRLDGRLHWVLSIDTDGARILAVYNILNPEKLRGMTLPEPHAP